MKFRSKLSHKEYILLTIPFVLSTITQPLLGAVDTAVVGRMSDPAYIGAVSIGTVIFNTIYWLFGFLRVSTSSYSAQAMGAQNQEKSMLAFVRPMFIAMTVGLLLILFQWPIRYFAISILNPEHEVAVMALKYFSILIWGAPLVLGNYVILGWLMGKTKLKETLFMQITTNVVNIILDLLFVMVLHYGVPGVAAATLISQFIGFAIGVVLMHRCGRFKWNTLTREKVFYKKEFKAIMSCNTDLIIRTICLLIMTNMFIAEGSRLGTVILAANAVLFQIQYIMAYAFDGLANAASVFAGKAVGGGDIELYDANVKRSGQWFLIFASLITLAYYFGQDKLLTLFTNIDSVLMVTSQYQNYLLWFPFVAAAGLVYYGIFTGTAKTKPVRNSMILALIVFLLAKRFLIPCIGNHGLWISFLVFSLGRSLFLMMYLPRIRRQLLKEQVFKT